MSEAEDGKRTAVVWFRRDLRLSDHRALAAALSESDQVVPLFVWDPALTGPAGPNRLRFLSGCVGELSRALGGRLVVRSGEPARMVADVARRCGASAVYVTEDHGAYGRLRDETVDAALGHLDPPVELRRLDSNYAVAPGRLVTQSGGPFQVFSPFARAWRAQGWEQPAPRPSPAARARIGDAGLESDTPPPLPDVAAALPEPGEKAAHRRLDAFLRSRGAASYGSERDRPDLDSTSRLSPYLRFGCVHPRQILDRLDTSSAHERFATELCWREFYADVMFHRPDAARVSYREEWRDFQVDGGRTADERFDAWTQGRTGYPLVDAGMRQLLGEGWMHNRVRMAAASFLVKDLHVDWTRGARWFMEHLVDGDLASNQLNWQWVAGCGTDAAPYFRVFNPVTQSRKFDPDGSYVRRWVPELAAVEGPALHEPWKHPGARVGDYPPPIVDHAAEREEALARYGAIISGAGQTRRS